MHLEHGTVAQDLFSTFTAEEKKFIGEIIEKWKRSERQQSYWLVSYIRKTEGGDIVQSDDVYTTESSKFTAKDIQDVREDFADSASFSIVSISFLGTMTDEEFEQGV